MSMNSGRGNMGASQHYPPLNVGGQMFVPANFPGFPGLQQMQHDPMVMRAMQTMHTRFPGMGAGVPAPGVNSSSEWRALLQRYQDHARKALEGGEGEAKSKKELNAAANEFVPARTRKGFNPAAQEFVPGDAMDEGDAATAAATHGEGVGVVDSGEGGLAMDTDPVTELDADAMKDVLATINAMMLNFPAEVEEQGVPAESTATDAARGVSDDSGSESSEDSDILLAHGLDSDDDAPPPLAGTGDLSPAGPAASTAAPTAASQNPKVPPRAVTTDPTPVCIVASPADTTTDSSRRQPSPPPQDLLEPLQAVLQRQLKKPLGPRVNAMGTRIPRRRCRCQHPNQYHKCTVECRTLYECDGSCPQAEQDSAMKRVPPRRAPSPPPLPSHDRADAGEKVWQSLQRSAASPATLERTQQRATSGAHSSNSNAHRASGGTGRGDGNVAHQGTWVAVPTGMAPTGMPGMPAQVPMMPAYQMQGMQMQGMAGMPAQQFMMPMGNNMMGPVMSPVICVAVPTPMPQQNANANAHRIR
eukprot:TRINITY_DN8065_c0_g1_i3.p1 TRINITY_DN8065_c0_g1~~TRINITY_DN8065_c0_g1_i3.p1  ORF type:complete len:529 (+),score=80.91 TRINITY_DN8065_c0_g1_i3:125-1711(+)